MKENDFYFEPREILKRIAGVDAVSLTEMTKWQQGFLCGLIKKHQPHKIVEIGVSAGGTTAVILNAIHMLGLRTELFSVDISETYYRDRNQPVGFLADLAKKNVPELRNVTHKLYTGCGIYEYIDRIGKDIDLLVLDTMHLLPGEILDFLICFPYLHSDAIVVMHDIAMQFASNREAYATQLLLDVVSADKIVGRDGETGFKTYPNIGAFRINPDTAKYIEDVFSGLNLPWSYYPEDLSSYRKAFIDHFDRDLVQLFDLASNNNQELIEKSKERKTRALGEMITIGRAIDNQKVYIYGNGKVGKRLHEVFQSCGVRIEGFIVSRGQPRGDNTYYLDELELTDHVLIVVGVGALLQKEVVRNLEEHGITKYIVLSQNAYEIIR